MKSKSSLELFSSLWAISPSSLYEYKPLFAKILSGRADSEGRELEANINYLVDENGDKIENRSNDIPPGTVGVVNLIGPMIKYGNWYLWGADELVEMLEALDKHPNVVGTILRIDSGGGAVKAVPVFANFLKRKKKPVVALCDICASAAIWVKSYCDYSFAENNISAMFGSIGVLAHLFSYKKFYEDLGIEEHIIVSDYSEDKNKAFTLAEKGKYKLIKEEYLNPTAKQFQETIKVKHPKLKQDVPGILKGKMFYAEQALEYGLINEIGTFEKAVQKVHELANINSFLNS
ncbi:S49 family peptidase [Aureivirga marina]|uniref:S49 family peptidase n=1 Tax=Aureivirga marina TaxID=1182451 RepID=UPI0018CB50BF|nr:S49 family peptidase [Aureivirga marina]